MSNNLLRAITLLALFISLAIGVAQAQLPRDGLVLDLNADKEVEVEAGNRVVKWINQVADSPAREFVKQDQGRQVPGSGRPTWRRAVAAIGGHDTIVFRRQELVNHHKDAFDRLITGSGYTWFAVLRVYPQVVQLKDVHSFFGNLRNGGNYEGIWGNVTDDNRVWIGSRNGITFGRWDRNNPMVLAPQPLEQDRYYLVCGRMGAGTGEVPIELFINRPEPVARKLFPVNPNANASKLAIGQERDATNHPGKESFDGELARFLIYDRPLNAKEMAQAFAALRDAYAPRVPPSTHNLLLDARVSGNLASYNKGRRGEPDHMIYDVGRGRFAKPSQYHEYGVGFGADLGVVPEDRPAYWLAEWPRPVAANFIVLRGVYDNQPQPDTAWKIELRHNGVWRTHARGVGDWYDRGRYVWGGRATSPVTFDALRVSVFSKDNQTPLQSIHFRGEQRLSWVVANLPPIHARIVAPRKPLHAEEPVPLRAETLAGRISSWRWAFGDGQTAVGQNVTQRFADAGDYKVTLTISDGKHSATVRRTLHVHSPLQIEMLPLTGPVMVNREVAFTAKAIHGNPSSYAWDFGDGQTAQGPTVRHRFIDSGIYLVKVTAQEGRFTDDCRALVRVHTPETVHVPQVLLDTDAKNEQDDQHYLAYALFSQLDVLGINSTHHGGGQEPINYGEILHVIELAKQSGLPATRVPRVFHGANQRLAVPDSGDWRDTEPIVTEASEAILAAARGASPDNPVWVLPVGPGTNPASAILQALREGLDLKGRIRILWLGGSQDTISRDFNGRNDPWSVVVIGRSGVETWIMPAPVSARVAMDKRTEGDLYADHPLGQYLKQIMPARNKALYDTTALATIISRRLGLGWIKSVDSIAVGGPETGYRWTRTDPPGRVRVVRDIDEQAMKRDLFNTIKLRPTRLLGVPRSP